MEKTEENNGGRDSRVPKAIRTSRGVSKDTKEEGGIKTTKEDNASIDMTDPNSKDIGMVV